MARMNDVLCAACAEPSPILGRLQYLFREHWCGLPHRPSFVGVKCACVHTYAHVCVHVHECVFLICIPRAPHPHLVTSPVPGL